MKNIEDVDIHNLINLNGNTLTLEQVIAVALSYKKVNLDADAMKQVKACSEYVAKAVDNGSRIYGVTTGFGINADKVIETPEKAAELQHNLLVSHACGTGSPLPVAVVRAMMCIRLNTLLQGKSGIRPLVLERLAYLLNERVHPIVPAQGSVGASGDLCPLAHLALPLIGLGSVAFERVEHEPSRICSAQEALSALGLSPLTLSYKEGLALINGTTLMNALGVLAAHRAQTTIHLAIGCTALAMDALCARKAALDSRLHEARRHRGQQWVAEQLHNVLSTSTLLDYNPESLAKESSPTLASALWNRFVEKKRVAQDAYSIRCSPQVLGASVQALAHVKSIVSAELNAITDNPLLFPTEAGGFDAISGGNFHGQPLALALDYLKIAVAEVGNFMERQLNKLLDPATNDGLPPFLSIDAGLHSGYMILQYAAAALVSENKVLAHPASVDSIPTSANQEDHVSMGPIGGRQALEMIDNVHKILAYHVLVAVQALALRQQQLQQQGVELQEAELSRQITDYLRNTLQIPLLEADRYLHPEVELVYNHVATLAGICQRHFTSYAHA